LSMAKEKLVTENPFKVFLNGKLVARTEAVVSLDSVAFKYAAMAFEGIRGYWNERDRQLFVFRLADHARRLQDSVLIMGMDTELNNEAFSRAVLHVLRKNSVNQNVHIRQMVFVEGNGEMFTKGPVGHAVVVTPKGGWFQGKDDGVHACVSSWQRISDNSIPPRVKCAANYQNGRLALLQARLDGYDCALLLNDRGKVSEEPRGSVFLVRRGEIITPKVTDDILESVTRETVITLLQDLCQREVIEREVDRTELYLADEIFLCGTGFEVLPVLSIDRHVIGGGKPGEITTLIRNTYLKAARGEEPKYRHWLTAVHEKEGPGA
jgi:branched-chain amino acid aminotransferase